MENCAFNRTHDFLDRGIWKLLANHIRSLDYDTLSPRQNLVYGTHRAALVATHARVLHGGR
jgi:hypothetical protein